LLHSTSLRSSTCYMENMHMNCFWMQHLCKIKSTDNHLKISVIEKLDEGSEDEGEKQADSDSPEEDLDDKAIKVKNKLNKKGRPKTPEQWLNYFRQFPSRYRRHIMKKRKCKYEGNIKGQEITKYISNSSAVPVQRAKSRLNRVGVPVPRGLRHPRLLPLLQETAAARIGPS
jgi:hypothetical protein